MNVSASRRFRRLLLVLLTCGLGLAGVAMGEAATVIQRTDAELAAMSERIVRARVLDVWTELARPESPNSGGIYTVTRLAVLEDFTGGSAAVIELQELGGVFGARRMAVPGAPTFEPGQEVVLLLERARNDRWRTVALAYSAFTVQRVGAEVTLTRELAGVDIVAPGAAGQSAAAGQTDAGVRTLARFRATVASVKKVAPSAPAGAAALQPSRSVAAPFTFLGDMRWMQADDGQAVTWYRDPAAGAPVVSGVDVDTVIGRALAAWTNPTEASITLTYGGTRSSNISTINDYCGPPNANVGIIVFEDPANDPDFGAGVLAIGGGCQDGGRSKVVNGHNFVAISHGFVIFNNKANISTSIQSEINFGRVLTHEIGHGIGLGHTSSSGNLMLPSCCSSGMPIPPDIGADDRAGVTFIYPQSIAPPPPPPPPVDTDGDGLLDAWEEQFGLNPGDPSGVNGAAGDPDGDGVNNAAEQANGTHPRGFVSRYFAEGAVNAFFDTQIALANSGSVLAHVLLRLQPQQDGVSSVEAERTLVVAVPAQSRVTVTADMLRARLSTAFATVIESDVPIVADRTMIWGNGVGSHAETAVIQPKATWYFAEGATGPLFSLYYLLQNPNDAPVTARIRYLRGGGQPPLVKDYPLPRKSRTTIDVRGERFTGDPPNAPPPLSIAEVSGVVTVLPNVGAPEPRPIIAERALYRFVPGQTFGAGHEGAAVPEPATNWFLAEGATGFFDQFILIANPNPSPVAVDVTYLLEGGGTRQKTYNVLPESRYTIQVNTETIGGLSFASAVFSTRLTATAPIIVERAMWWRNGPSDWIEGHNVAGATQAGTRWVLAEGETGGARNTQTFILVANVGAQPSRLRVTYFLEPTCGSGAEACPPLVREQTKVVPANARQTINPADDPALRGRRFSALIESLDAQPLVVERAMYSDAGGVFWAAGTASLGTLLTPVP